MTYSKRVLIFFIQLFLAIGQVLILNILFEFTVQDSVWISTAIHICVYSLCILYDLIKNRKKK